MRSGGEGRGAGEYRYRGPSRCRKNVGRWKGSDGDVEGKQEECENLRRRS